MGSEARIRIKWNELYQYMTDIWNSGFPEEIYNRSGEDTKGCMSTSDSCLLYACVRYFKPKRCLETGARRGKASSFILKGLEDNGTGRLIGIERDKSVTIGELIPQKLKYRFDPVNAHIEKFVESSEFKNLSLDLFLHDSTHRYKHQFWEFNTFWEILDSGGVLCSHDVDYNDSFLDFVKLQYVVDQKGLTDFDKNKFGVWGKMSNFGFVTKR